VSFNYAKARQIPSFTPDPSVGSGEFRMRQADVERSQEFRKCIECYLCQDICHVIRDRQENEDAFAGPRFLMRVAELEMHPADTADRREIARDDFGLGCCNITKCCTEVCRTAKGTPKSPAKSRRARPCQSRPAREAMPGETGGRVRQAAIGSDAVNVYITLTARAMHQG